MRTDIHSLLQTLRARRSLLVLAATGFLIACSSTPLVNPKEQTMVKPLLTPTIVGTLTDGGTPMAEITLYLSLVETRRDNCFEKNVTTVSDSTGQFTLPGIEPSGTGSVFQRFEVEWQVCAEVAGEIIPLWYDYHAGILTGDAVTAVTCDLATQGAAVCAGDAYSATSNTGGS